MAVVSHLGVNYPRGVICDSSVGNVTPPTREKYEPEGTFFFAPHRYFHENRTSADIDARRGARCHAPPPPWLCNKVLKPNFQSTISETNNDCSVLTLILAKLLLLDISCEIIFALSIVTALIASSFSIKIVLK